VVLDRPGGASLIDPRTHSSIKVGMSRRLWSIGQAPVLSSFSK